MFCPECEAEYRPGFTRCSDCDVALVSALAPEEMDCAHKEGQVTVFVTRDMVEAQTVKQLLEANNIEVCVSGESSPLPGFPCEVRLTVNQHQANFAHELLEESILEESIEDDEGDEDVDNIVPFPMNTSGGTSRP